MTRPGLPGRVAAIMSFRLLTRRVLPAFALFEWGAILAYFYFSHRITAFIHPDFRLLVFVSGLLLMATSACVFFAGSQEVAAGNDCGDGDCCDCSASWRPGAILVFAVLFLPIALAAKVAPDHYGAVLIRNRGVTESLAKTPGMIERLTASSAPKAAAASTPPVGIPSVGATAKQEPPAQVEVGDLLLAAQNPAAMQNWAGKRVELIGQFSPVDTKSFELVRLLMLCCAADAQALAVRVENTSGLAVPDMGWAKVVGTVSFTKRDGADVPLVTAESIAAVPQPDDPYVYHGGSRPVQHQVVGPVVIPFLKR